jgi:riboflavin synthase alpha subunit
VEVERHSGGELPHKYVEYEMHTHSKAFEADEEMGGYMMQGDIYTIYYIENLDSTGDEILSLEWVAKG